MGFDAELAVIGAGPVGLAAALCAVKAGLKVILLEQNETRPRQSRAIGVTPPSLALMRRLGIDDDFIAGGVAVRQASGHTKTKVLGRVSFDGMKTPWPFILAIPQHRTEQILESRVHCRPEIDFRRGCTVESVALEEDGVRIGATQNRKTPLSIRTRFVLACDGSRSRMREQAGIAWKGAPYRHTFLMADYTDRTGWGATARLYFTARGSIESFPLPGNQRRFVLRTPQFIKENESDFLEREIPRRSDINVDKKDKVWESAFGVQRFLAHPFARGRLFLCGDAAHVMSPIGGQNMNCGFADAECAAWCVVQALSRPDSLSSICAQYHAFRRKAALNAGLRAELMMRCGTSGGRLWNLVRSAGTALGLNSPLRSILFGMFTMLSLPNNDFEYYRPRLERALAS
jgi:2-polyprenyl-6-methoxyphenol hydroxylase-like FAD-dependent oxidoreductase